MAASGKYVLTLGWAVIDWAELHLCHGPGDVLGDPLEFTDEQCRHLVDAYAIDRQGRRLIRNDILSRPKGWSKSEFAGALACTEALGPVRFSHWAEPDEDGLIYPVGRPVTSPEVLCVATEEGQTGNTYDNVVVMLSHVKEHFPEYAGLDVGLTRTFLPDGGEITPVTAKAASKDGGKSTFVVFDETHLYNTKQLRELHRTIRRNLGKRGAVAEPWSLETTTMYRPGEDSIAERSHQYREAIADGRRKGDRSLLFDHRGLPDDYELDFSKDAELRKALKRVYGDATHVNLDYVIAEIRDPRADEADSRRYWLNQRHQGSQQAFDSTKWATLVDSEPIPDGELVVLGFDGSKFRDATALVVTHVVSGRQHLFGCWERPDNAPDDWEIADHLVDEIVEEAFSRWNVWRMYADPPHWSDAIDRWAGSFGSDRVAKWYTWRHRPMAFACRAFAEAIRAGTVTHDGDPRLARHVANARREDTKMRDDEAKPLWVIAKDYPNSPRHIDAATAAVLSWECRGDAIAAGVHRRRKGRLTGVTV